MSEGVKRKAERIETIDLSDSDSVLDESPSSSAKKLHCGSDDLVFLDSDSNDEQPKAVKKTVIAEESEPAKHDRLIKEFILITKTDSKVAGFFLEQHNWQLEVAVNDFLSLSGEILSEDTTMAKSLQNEKWAKDASTSSEVKGAFSFITWNVDGLDKRNLSPRTTNLIAILKKEAADVIFLQEVVPETINHLKSNLPKYNFAIQQYERHMTEAYFVCTLTKKETVKVISQKEIPFENSVMMRALLMVEVEIGGNKFWLLNTHLESTAQYKQARVNQLKAAFKHLSDKSSTHSILFAGDLNLRDAELPLAGGIPAGAVDLWEACDKRETCRYTWDAARNSNIQLSNFNTGEGSSRGKQFKPKLRFDRAYLCPCKKDNADRPFAKHFGLIGISKVPNMQCYTSDHWGLQIYFTVNKA